LRLSGAAVTYNANVSDVLGEIGFHANSPFCDPGDRDPAIPRQSAKVRHQVSSAGLRLIELSTSEKERAFVR
jgi:hypothetical protein